MKITVTSATGISCEALLDKDSGVIEFKDGEISHVLFEKQFNKKIMVLKDAPKEEPESSVPSAEQSEPRPAKKTKRK